MIDSEQEEQLERDHNKSLEDLGRRKAMEEYRRDTEVPFWKLCLVMVICWATVALICYLVYKYDK